MARQQVIVHLTAAQALRCEKPGEHLWPAEKLSVEEVSRLLLLEHLLWAESERNLVESRVEHVEHCSRATKVIWLYGIVPSRRRQLSLKHKKGEAMNNELMSDDEHLLREIRDCIRAAEKYRAEERPLGPEAFRALDRANRAAEKLCERLCRLRAELDAIVAATTELNSAVLRPHLVPRDASS